MSTSNCAENDVKVYEFNRKAHSVCLAILLAMLAIAVIGSYILGEPIPSPVELASSKLAMLLIIDYVTIVTFMACLILSDKRSIKNSQKHADAIDELQIKNDKLQRELVESERKNSKLEDDLAESERKRKEAERLTAQYRRLLSKEQRETEESLRIANLNRPQRTSDRSRNISGCPRQQEYPKDVRTV